MYQKLLVILKPDCVERGLADEVILLITERGLRVSNSDTRVLERSELLSLYEEVREESFFEDLLSYMQEGPSRILVVEGEHAISELSDLKGRTGSGRGIRGKYAESFIRNLVHSAESPFKASREVRLFFPKEGVEMNSKMLMLGLSGMTECGKSSAGLYFDTIGIKRVKMVKIMERLWHEHPGTFEDVGSFGNYMLKHRPEWFRLAFADMLLKVMAEEKFTACSLESMGDPAMVEYLHARFPGEFFSLYVDATLEKRLEHQIIRENLSTLEEARAILLPKDDFKSNFWHMEDIKPLADYVIDNNGTYEEFIARLNDALSDLGYDLPEGA